MDMTVIIENDPVVNIVNVIDMLLLQQGVDYHIILIDKTNDIDLVKRITSQYHPKVTVMTMSADMHYTKAMNQAARLAESTYLFLLNPKIQLQDPHVFSNMRHGIEIDDQYKMVACQVIDNANHLHEVLKREYLKAKFAHHQYQELPGIIAWLKTLCVIIDRQLFVELGGFDETFRCHGADADFSIRLRQAGYQLAYHKAVSVKLIDQPTKSPQGYYQQWMLRQQGLYRFLYKHYDRPICEPFIQYQLDRAASRKLQLHVKKRIVGLTKNNHLNYHRYCAIYDVAKAALTGEL